MAKRRWARRSTWELNTEQAAKAVAEQSRGQGQPGGLEAVSVQRHGLPAHSTAAALNHAAVLQMQRRYGNAASVCSSEHFNNLLESADAGKSTPICV